ncbi:MAG: hypothetical protein H7Y28_09875 [Rhodoferax sp.]|nr:hypothetical protein [Rhodoferax sp.]
MQHRANYTFTGRTAAGQEGSAFSAQELMALCEHLSGCSHTTGRLDYLRSVCQRVHGFAAARLVTTCAVVAVLVWIVLIPV